MRLTTILLLVFSLHLSARVVSQITFRAKDMPLEDVFNKIQQQNGYAFFYSIERIKAAKKVTINVNNVSLKEFLDVCLKDQLLDYNIDGETVFIVPRKEEIVTKNNAPRPVFTAEIPQEEITIRVTNTEDEPLVGASVVVKKTGKVYQTDVRGDVNLKNVEPGDVVEISFVGYTTISLKLDAKTFVPFVPVRLEPASNELDVAIVQGYGTTTKRLTTGNIAKVTAEEIKRQPVMNALIALQGKVPGLNVTQLNGFASAPVKVELRGRNVIGVRPDESFPSDPLYIVDGVPLTILEIGGGSSYTNGSTGFLQSFVFRGPAGGQSPFFSINPADIESIEVLKDADATAIYGSRGANGVILVTTKKGKAGKTNFNLSINQGITKVTRYWDMMKTEQYLQMRKQAYKNDNIEPAVIDGYDLLIWDSTRYTDWQRELFGKTGKSTGVQAEMSGGNSQTTFYIGAGFKKGTPFMAASGGDTRGSLSFSIGNHSRNQKFRVSLSGAYSLTQSDLISFPAQAMILPPNAPPIYDSAGNLNYAGFGGLNGDVRATYPFSSLRQPYTSKTNFLTSSLGVEFKLLKGLNLRVSAGYNKAQANQEQLTLLISQDPLTNPTGMANWAYNNVKNLIIEPQATYETYLGKGHLSLLAGGTFQENTTEGVITSGAGYTSDDLINTITNAPVQASGRAYGVYRYAAVFGRISYNWKNKYIINLNGRRDGSSHFGKNSQYGNFGSIGTAWIFTEEEWLKEHITFLSFGKIRASYGTTGSDALGEYKYLTRWSATNTTPYGGVTTMVPTQHANPYYQWPVNKKMEGGIDLGLFRDRLSISAAYYRNRCGNQLVQMPMAGMTGFANVTANSPALVQNDGWEFSFSTRLINTEKIKSSINFNTSFGRNKLLAYPNLEQSPYASTLVIGQSLTLVQRLHYIGIDPQTGLPLVEDKNHDGQIVFEPGKENSDTYVYDLTPKFTGGGGINFSYKNLHLSTSFMIVKQIGKNCLTAAGNNARCAG